MFTVKVNITQDSRSGQSTLFVFPRCLPAVLASDTWKTPGRSTYYLDTLQFEQLYRSDCYPPEITSRLYRCSNEAGLALTPNINRTTYFLISHHNLFVFLFRVAFFL